jgi:hypothetical protein
LGSWYRWNQRGPKFGGDWKVKNLIFSGSTWPEMQLHMDLKEWGSTTPHRLGEIWKNKRGINDRGQAQGYIYAYIYYVI